MSDLRGGNELPVLVRKTEPKPLRDLFAGWKKRPNDIYCGSWWVANQDMLASLQWAGYEVNHEWGEGGHNRKHGNAIMPEVLRWLCGKTGTANPGIRNSSRAIPGARPRNSCYPAKIGNWSARDTPSPKAPPSMHRRGDLYFSDLEESKIWKVDGSGKVSLFQENTGNTNGLAFAPDGKTLYGCQGEIPGNSFPGTWKQEHSRWPIPGSNRMMWWWLTMDRSISRNRRIEDGSG